MLVDSEPNGKEERQNWAFLRRGRDKILVHIVVRLLHMHHDEAIELRAFGGR